MKEVAKILIILALSMFLFYFVYSYFEKNNTKEEIENYIEETSIVENEDILEETETIVEEKESTKREIAYKAILEIPSIDLREGLVDNTKNFNSINYAVSIDNNSSYPDEMGNFILYAHSGNSNIAFFKNLYKLGINDNVYVYYNGIKYEYVIYEKSDIEKTGKAKVINSNNQKYITLITCNQAKKDYQIVIVGKLINQENY